VVHHTGKPKRKDGRADQRGTSKREDVLNTSILLYTKLTERGRFTVEFSKTRGFKAPDDFTVLIEHDEDAGLCRLVRDRKTSPMQSPRCWRRACCKRTSLGSLALARPP
jgi:hypothetical protein